jgi:hypothetical protein
MSTSRPTPAQAARRNRTTLLIVLALFFGGMLAAGALRFSGWHPAGTKVHGELLQPPVDLRERAPALMDGAPYAWDPPARTWRIVVAPPLDCGAACSKAARDLDVVWRLMGSNADHVEVLWLCADLACAVPAPLHDDRALRRLRADAALRALLPGADAGGGTDAGASLPLYVIDPNGFLILRYAPGADPGGLRADLAKLLKLI